MNSKQRRQYLKMKKACLPDLVEAFSVELREKGVDTMLIDTAADLMYAMAKNADLEERLSLYE